jgi:hypothetical protein
MTNDYPDFDALSRKATTTNAMEDLNELFGAAFALKEWYFISRGEMPNVYPHVASNAQYADNQPLIRAFTDTQRLQRFARENGLTDADGNALMLSIPTEHIVEYLEGFIPQGAYGVWFNSDTGSDGFFVPIKQMRPIREHLAKINRPENDAPKSSVETLQFVVKEGLMLPTAEIIPAPHTSNVFWRVPADWLENGEIKADHLRTFEQELSGGDSETIPGAFYIAVDYETRVFTPAETKTIDFRAVKEKSDEPCTFFIVSESGEVRMVSAEEFQKDADASIESDELPPRSNLQNRGLAEESADEIEPNLTVNKIGAVNFDMSIIPFREALGPLLENYRGTDEFSTLLRFEPDGISKLDENIAENSHGAYLQIRRFQYLNPKNNVCIGVSSIHSNRLRHIHTNSELLVSFELCKNPGDRTAAFYHAIQGLQSEVLRLSEAIRPLLEAVGYQAVAQQNSEGRTEDDPTGDGRPDDPPRNADTPEQSVLSKVSQALRTDAERDRLAYWFDVSDNVRSSNELYTDYAYTIPEKHFASFGLELKRGLHEKDLNWSSFCWYFYRHVCNFTDAEEHRPMMRKIFADFAEFCAFAPGNADGRYAVLLNDFLVDFKLPENIAALLPEKILAKLPELAEIFGHWKTAAAEHEEELFRQGMMGY